MEIAHLFNIAPETVLVVTAGMDIPTLFQRTDTCRLIESKLHLLDADLLFLLPARLTRRKNMGLGLRILHELKKQDHRDCCLIVSGPPSPHNPSNPGYLGALLEMRNRLGLQNSAHFLYELEEPPLAPDDATMANLYQVADALLFPSLQEGFGIPILEAGLVGLPIFCSDLEPFHETEQNDVVFFQPTQDIPENIATMIRTYFTANPRQRLKTRVRQQYRWNTIIRRQLIPLLEAS